MPFRRVSVNRRWVGNGCSRVVLAIWVEWLLPEQKAGLGVIYFRNRAKQALEADGRHAIRSEMAC